MKNVKNDACTYLLTGLLQRLDNETPGLIKEMILGVEGDRSSIPEDTKEKEHINKIFDEALLLLNRANNA